MTGGIISQAFLMVLWNLQKIQLMYFLFFFSYRLRHRWDDICAFRVFPCKCQLALQLCELKDDYIQQEIKKPPKEETCNVCYHLVKNCFSMRMPPIYFLRFVKCKFATVCNICWCMDGFWCLWCPCFLLIRNNINFSSVWLDFLTQVYQISWLPFPAEDKKDFCYSLYGLPHTYCQKSYFFSKDLLFWKIIKSIDLKILRIRSQLV